MITAVVPPPDLDAALDATRTALDAAADVISPDDANRLRAACDASAVRIATARAAIAKLAAQRDDVPLDRLPALVAERVTLIAQAQAEIEVLASLHVRADAAIAAVRRAERERQLDVLRQLEAEHLADGEALDRWWQDGDERLRRFIARQRVLYSERLLADLPRGVRPGYLIDVFLNRLSDIGVGDLPRASDRTASSFATVAQPVVPPDRSAA